MIPRLVMHPTTRVVQFLQTHAPSNRIVASVRRDRAGMGAACGLLLLSVIYLGGAMLAGVAAQSDGLGALNLLVLLFTWNALKFAWTTLMCPIRSLTSRLRCTGTVEAEQRLNSDQHKHPRSAPWRSDSKAQSSASGCR